MGERLTSCGVEHDHATTLAIHAREGFVSVCTRRLPEPLGRTQFLHALACLVAAGLKVWPDAADAVTAVVETARAHADASKPTGVA